MIIIDFKFKSNNNVLSENNKVKTKNPKTFLEFLSQTNQSIFQNIDFFFYGKCNLKVIRIL